MLLKACLNGSRSPAEHPALPVTPVQLSADTVAAVAAGAQAVHIHPKDATGADTLDAAAVAAALDSVRAAAPGIPIGVTTGAWAVDSQAQRLTAVRDWRVLPDFASVNWHETGAAELAAVLLDRGIGVEAGLWTQRAVASWNSWPRRAGCLRVLLEIVDDLTPAAAVAAAGELLDALAPSPGIPVLLHGEGASAWPILHESVRRRLDVRIGLEDVLLLPNGQLAPNNAALVVAARRIIGDLTVTG